MTENEKKPWYDDLPPDDDAIYEESVSRIRNGVMQSNLTFANAVELIDVKDDNLRAAILDDSLKVLIAEIHFSGGRSLEDLSRKLKVPLAKLEQARKEMLKDVEDAAIEKYKLDSGQSGNA